MRLAVCSRHRGAVLPVLALVVLSATTSSQNASAQGDAPGDYQQQVPGLLSRSIFKGSAGNSTVEVIDLLVGARKASEEITTPNPAMLDVQAGDAKLLVDGKPQQLRPGAVIPLDRDQRITIDNSGGEQPFVARMIVVSPAQR
jgi:hypothetical protein